MSYGVIVKEYGYPRYKEAPATIFSDFLDYVKANKDVWRVVVPHTGYGYGTTFVDSANIEWMEDHYRRAFKLMEYNGTISRAKFLASDELQQIIAGLAEDYPLISDEYHSRIESAARLEHFRSELADIEDVLTFDQVDDVLAYSGYSWWELVHTDSDGATVYMLKDDLELIATLISELAENNG